MKAVIWSKDNCQFCIKAKTLLDIKGVSYEERKESGKKKNKLEKVVKDSERKIEKMESRLKELDKKLCTPEGASDMKLCGEYTATKKDLDQEIEKWERLSEELESLE